MKSQLIRLLNAIFSIAKLLEVSTHFDGAISPTASKISTCYQREMKKKPHSF